MKNKSKENNGLLVCPKCNEALKLLRNEAHLFCKACDWRGSMLSLALQDHMKRHQKPVGETVFKAMVGEDITKAERNMIGWTRAARLSVEDRDARYTNRHDEGHNKPVVKAKQLTNQMPEVSIYGNESGVLHARTFMVKKDEWGEFHVYGSQVPFGYDKKLGVEPRDGWEREATNMDKMSIQAIKKIKQFLEDHPYTPPDLCDECENEIPFEQQPIKTCKCGRLQVR